MRILQGLGGGPVVPMSQAVMWEIFPLEQRGTAMAVWGFGIMLAPILGPTVGGYIADNWSWRWIFYINLPIGILGFLMVSAFLYDTPFVKRPTGIDLFGVVSMVVGFGCLQLMLDLGCRLSALAVTLMSHVTVSMDYWSLAWPRFLHGFSMGFIFVPLQALTLATVRVAGLGNATAAYNVVRNVGSSAGVALATA